MAARRRRQQGPMAAAGLIAFYEEYEGRLKLSPTSVIVIAAAFAALVATAHLFLG